MYFCLSVKEFVQQASSAEHLIAICVELPKWISLSASLVANWFLLALILSWVPRQYIFITNLIICKIHFSKTHLLILWMLFTIFHFILDTFTTLAYRQFMSRIKIYSFWRRLTEMCSKFFFHFFYQTCGLAV